MENSKPNVVLHMMEHGMLGGTWLGLIIWASILLSLLGVYILNATDASLLFGGLLVIALYALPVLFIVSTTSLLVGLLGIILGMFNGLLLRNLTERIHFPAKDDIFIRWHIAAIACNPMFIVSLLAGALSIYGAFVFHWLALLGFLPVVFLGIAAAFASHRYMLKLQDWGRYVEKMKNKSKHPPRNNLTYTDNLNPEYHLHSEKEEAAHMKQE